MFTLLYWVRQSEDLHQVSVLIWNAWSVYRTTKHNKSVSHGAYSWWGEIKSSLWHNDMLHKRLLELYKGQDLFMLLNCMSIYITLVKSVSLYCWIQIFTVIILFVCCCCYCKSNLYPLFCNLTANREALFRKINRPIIKHRLFPGSSQPITVLAV